jgi:hypothetical protein
MNQDYDITANFERIAQASAKIVDFLFPKGPFVGLSMVEASVRLKNTGASPAAFWVGLSFAHETATNAGWPDGWQDVDPIPTEVVAAGQEIVVSFNHLLAEGLCGQYYAASAIWAGYNTQSDVLTTTLDDTRDYDIWRDKETGVKSFFWLPWNSVCLSNITFDRMPPRASQREIRCGGSTHIYEYKDPLGLSRSIGLSIYADVSNNSQEMFDGFVSFSHLLDPQGQVYNPVYPATVGASVAIVDLKPGSTVTVVLPIVAGYTGPQPGTWQVPLELKQGKFYLFAETIETKHVAFEVVADDEDIASVRPGGTIIPVHYHPSQTLKWITAMELWSALLLSPFGVDDLLVEAMAGPYKQYLEELDYVNEELSNTARVTIHKATLVGDQRSLSVEWKNFLTGGPTSSTYYDRCIVEVVMPAGIEVIDPGLASPTQDSEGATHLFWDVQRLGKGITPGDKGSFTFTIRDPSAAITVEATAVLMVGPYEGAAGDSWTHISDYPWTINYKTGNYWYALSGATDTVRIP